MRWVHSQVLHCDTLSALLSIRHRPRREGHSVWVSDLQKKKEMEELDKQRFAQVQQSVLVSVGLLAGKTSARAANDREVPAVPLDIVLCPSIQSEPRRGVRT